jgi:hypothetical protein
MRRSDLTHHDGAGPEDDQQLARGDPQHLVRLNQRPAGKREGEDPAASRGRRSECAEAGEIRGGDAGEGDAVRRASLRRDSALAAVAALVGGEKGRPPRLPRVEQAGTPYSESPRRRSISDAQNSRTGEALDRTGTNLRAASLPQMGFTCFKLFDI